MSTALGLILLLAGLALEVLALTGQAGGAPALAAAGGGVAYLLGAIALGWSRGPEGRFATHETVLIVALGGSLGFTGAVAHALVAGWSQRAVGALACGAWAETLVAVLLCVRVAVMAEKSKALFIPSTLATCVLGLLHLVLVTLSMT